MSWRVSLGGPLICRGWASVGGIGNPGSVAMFEGRYTGRGVALGCAAATVLWVFPLPVAFLAWLAGSRRPFGDIMLLALPFLLLLPVVGGILGWHRHRRDDTSDE
jgi:hypothetical protein